MIGFVLLALRPFIADVAIFLMVDDAVSEAARSGLRTYIDTRLLAAPFAIAGYAGIGWLSGQGRTGVMLATVFATTALNAALDVIFVLQHDMGVEGIALGTAIAEGMSLVFLVAAIWFVLAREKTLSASWSPRRWHEGLSAFVSLNRDIFIRTLLLSVAFAWFFRASAAFGDVTLAANQVLMQIILMFGLLLDGPAIAAEALVGQALGRPVSERSRYFGAAARSTGGLTLVFAVLVLATVVLLDRQILGALLPVDAAPEVRAEARAFYVWVVVSPFTMSGAFWLDGLYIAATRGRDLRDVVALAMATYVLAYLLAVPAMGNHGLWLAFSLFLLVRAAGLSWRWRGAFGPRALEQYGRTNATSP